MVTHESLLKALAQAKLRHNPSLRVQALRDALQPTSAEIEAYNGHARTVERRMELAFPGAAVEVMGSHSRGTANQAFSDMDLLLRLPREYVYRGNTIINSNTVLGWVRKELEERYTATGIRRDGQAVVANFGQGRFAADVVPAIFAQMVKPFTDVPARPAFLIPDGAGGWMLTSPQAHNKFIADADSRSGGKLKFVVQMVKYWRDCRSPAYPLLSFHLELLMAAEGLCVGVMSYQQCLHAVFRALRLRGCRPLRDPLGISGVISAAGTRVQQAVLLAAVERASVRSAHALVLESQGKFGAACEQWDMLFNRHLPAAP